MKPSSSPRTDPGDLPRRRSRPEGRQPGSNARDRPADVLPLEGEVRRDGAHEMQRLKQVEDENRPLKQITGCIECAARQL